MRVESTFVVTQRGIGKPDYSKEVSSARERSGLRLAYRQALEIAGIVFSSANGGIHTAAISATIMTDATALFVPSALIGYLIVNVTDGSSGTIIANTTTTIAVAALIGGATNQWNPGDVYSIPSPFAWVQAPLAAGAKARFIDNVTGAPFPLTVPVGYTMTFIAAGGSFTEDAIAWVYFDGLLIISGGVMAGGQVDYENKVVGITTATVDPTGLTSHTIDIQITNRGLGNLEGGTEWVGILEAVSTPPLPLIKVIRCKWCGHEETVPVEQTKLICPKCGRLTMVYALRHFRETA